MLFVCHGNIMRSALAHELLSSRLTQGERSRLAIRSAGLHAVPGREADTRMGSAALDLGVSLATHRATLISEELVASSDLVFVMDYANEAELLSRFPGARSKTLFLGTLAPSPTEREEIVDPFLGSDEDTRRCAGRVRSCVDALVLVLRGAAPTS